MSVYFCSCLYSYEDIDCCRGTGTREATWTQILARRYGKPTDPLREYRRPQLSLLWPQLDVGWSSPVQLASKSRANEANSNKILYKYSLFGMTVLIDPVKFVDLGIPLAQPWWSPVDSAPWWGPWTWMSEQISGLLVPRFQNRVRFWCGPC